MIVLTILCHRERPIDGQSTCLVKNIMVRPKPTDLEHIRPTLMVESYHMHMQNGILLIAELLTNLQYELISIRLGLRGMVKGTNM